MSKLETMDSLQIISNSDKLFIEEYANNQILIEVYDGFERQSTTVLLNREQKEALIKFLTREVEE